jgi:hypothetical protein
MKKDVTHSDYLADPAYGSTDIIRMGKSFAYYKYKKENPDKGSRPLDIGSATHLLLQSCLTNDKSLEKGILVYPDGSSLTKGFKEFRDKNKGAYCLDIAEHSLCVRMVGAIMNDTEAMHYLRGAEAEQSYFAKFPGTDINVKVRPDYLHIKQGVSINVKTANDASEYGFINSTKDWGYDWQSSFYCAILTEELQKKIDEIHIVVEKMDDDKEPPIVNVFTFGDDTIQFARSQIWELLQKIPECEKTGIWPNKRTCLQTVEVPQYARRIVMP